MANNEVTLKAVVETNAETERAITPYEEKLIKVLEKALKKRLSTSNLGDNIFLYEDLCKAGKTFIENVVLPGRWAKLQSLRLQRPDAADMCVEHIFFDKLDYTLEHETATEIIKLINTMVKNYLEDLWRKEKRHRCVSINADTSSEEDNEKEDEVDEMRQGEQAVGEKKAPNRKTAAQAKEVPVHADWNNLSKDCYSISCERELSIGDKIVHKKFGLGYYNGSEVIRVNGVNKQYIKVSYADRDTLFVPVEQLDMVSKYTGNHATITAFTKAEDKTSACSKALPNIHLEKGWDLVASGENLEDRAVNSDLAFVALTEMKRNPNAYEVVCFLETKMVGDKAGSLTHDFENMDQNAVCERVLNNATKFFSRVIETDFFKDAAFGNNENGYQVVINGNVSHASDRCRNKVRKIIATNM